MSESKELYKLEPGEYINLKEMCLRYWAHKLKIEDILESGGGGMITHSRSVGRYSDPTANKALKLIDPEAECEFIERTMKKVCADYDVLADAKKTLRLSDFLLLNVTTFNKYNSYRSLIRRGYRIPVGYDKFYFLRYKFFYELHKTKIKI